MIIDEFGVFFNDTAADASMTSDVVSLSSYAGREDPVYITLLAKGANAATFTVHVQQSEDNSTFTAAGSFTMTKEAGQAQIQTIRLPVALKQAYVRLAAEAAGTLTGVTLFAAVTRDHFAPYDKGLYIDGGKVVA